MVDIKRPKHCNGCVSHHNTGQKGTVFQNWCCAFQGGHAPKMVGHCKQMDGHRPQTASS